MVSPKKTKVGGIMQSRRLSLIGVMSAPDRPGLVARIFGALGQEHINVQFIVQSIDLRGHAHMLFCVAQGDAAQVRALMAPVGAELGAEGVTCEEPVAMLSVYGPDFRERPGIAALTFGALASVSINILAISTSISTITCVIADEHFEEGIAALHRVFDLP
jgi:aspartate kinase